MQLTREDIDKLFEIISNSKVEVPVLCISCASIIGTVSVEYLDSSVKATVCDECKSTYNLTTKEVKGG